MANKGDAESEDRDVGQTTIKKTKELMKQIKDIHKSTTKLLTAAEQYELKEAFRKELPALTQSVAKQQKQIVESFEEVAGLGKRLENLLERQQADEERWARLDVQEERMAKLVEDLGSRQKEDESRWAGLEGRLKATAREEDALARVTGRLESLGGQVAMLEATGDAVAQLTGRLDEIEKQIGGIVVNVDAIGALRGRLDSLERSGGGRPALPESLQATISTFDSRLKSVEEKELEGRMKVIEVQAMDTRVKNLESQGSGGGAHAKNDLKALTERLSLIEERSAARVADVAVLGEKVGHLEEATRKVEETRGAVQSTRESVSGLENKVSAIGDEMRRMEDAVERLEPVSSEVARVSDRLKEIDQLHERTDSIVAKMDQASASLGSLEELQRKLDSVSGAETSLTQKLTELESLVIPKLVAQVTAAAEKAEAAERSVDVRLEEDLTRAREEMDLRFGRAEKSVKDRDERIEEMDQKIAQLELERDRITALDEMVKKRLLPDPSLPKMHDGLARVERRLDAHSEEASVTNRQLEEERVKVNRALDKIAKLEATPPGAIAKQEFAAQEMKIAILEETLAKMQKDLKAQKEQIMLVLEDQEGTRQPPAR